MRSLRAMLILALTQTVLAAPTERVDNFTLLDHRGVAHELYYYSDAKAIVLFAHSSGCHAVERALPKLKALRDNYAARGIQFLLLNSNLQDQRDILAKQAAVHAIDLPILIDSAHSRARLLALRKAAKL